MHVKPWKARKKRAPRAIVARRQSCNLGPFAKREQTHFKPGRRKMVQIASDDEASERARARSSAQKMAICSSLVVFLAAGLPGCAFLVQFWQITMFIVDWHWFRCSYWHLGKVSQANPISADGLKWVLWVCIPNGYCRCKWGVPLGAWAGSGGAWCDFGSRFGICRSSVALQALSLASVASI